MLPCSFLGHSPMGYTTEAARRPSPSQSFTSQCWLESKDQLCTFVSFSKAWAASRSKLCFLKPDFGQGHPEMKVSWIWRGQDEKALFVPWERTLHDTPWVLPGLGHLVANLHFFSAANHSKRKMDLQKGKGQ